MVKVIMHVDLNYFFVRCEEIKNPKLINKAVMIGGIGRAGIVSTCSYKAREYGVKSGMPSYQAIKLCPNIITLPGDYKFYSLMSKEFFAYVRKFSNKVEIASIDECYVDITDVVKNKNNVNEILENFQSGLFKKYGLKCSIGVGTTKFIAKMASDLKKPMGITIIRNKDIEKILYPLDIISFFGIGKKSAPKLKSIGIKTIGDLANFIFNNSEKAKMYFGTYYYDIKACLEAKSSSEITTEISDPKSIGNSMTLFQDSNDIGEISKALSLLSEEISKRAKQEKMVGKTIQLTLKDTEFKLHNKSFSLDEYTNDENTIYQIGVKLYSKYFTSGLYRLVGLALQNLKNEQEKNVQMTLFNFNDYTKENEIGDIINNINRKLKKPALKKASSLLKEKKNGN